MELALFLSIQMSSDFWDNNHITLTIIICFSLPAIFLHGTLLKKCVLPSIFLLKNHNSKKCFYPTYISKTKC